MVWVYDKRSANGCAFVYFGCVPIDSNTPEAKLLIAYTRRVLDALDVKNGTQPRAFASLLFSTTINTLLRSLCAGASHGEVMMTNDGPCLVVRSFGYLV